MIAISATLQNWGKEIGKTCCQQVRSSFVSFPFSFVSLSSSLVSQSLSLIRYLLRPPPPPLLLIHCTLSIFEVIQKFTFIRRMKKSKLLMMKKETRIVHIHSSNEEEARTPDEEETRIAHIHSVTGRRDKNSSHSFGE